MIDAEVSAKLQAPVVKRRAEEKKGDPGGIPRAAFWFLFGGAKRNPHRSAEYPTLQGQKSLGPEAETLPFLAPEREISPKNKKSPSRSAW